MIGVLHAVEFFVLAFDLHDFGVKINIPVGAVIDRKRRGDLFFGQIVPAGVQICEVQPKIALLQPFGRRGDVDPRVGFFRKRKGRTAPAQAQAERIKVFYLFS